MRILNSLKSRLISAQRHHPGPLLIVRLKRPLLPAATGCSALGAVVCCSLLLVTNRVTQNRFATPFVG